MNKVLVTGAAGFIGTNLIRELLLKEYYVVGIDNFSTGCIGNILRNRDVGNGRFEFYEEDVNSCKFYKFCKDVDVIFHLAAIPNVQFSVKYPVKSNYSNVNGTINVLESARKAKVKKVIFSSSSSVYGDIKEFPTKESFVLSPKSPYALQKQMGEQYMKLYSNLYGLDTVCLRYFNVCGPFQKCGGAYSSVIPAFMDKAVNGDIITINGDGSIVRDFCPVENVVNANILAAQYNDWFGGEIFNIACGETHSINDVYNKICELSKKEIPKINGPQKKEDPIKSHADISKAKEILKYTPSIKFEEAMINIWNWWNNKGI